MGVCGRTFKKKDPTMSVYLGIDIGTSGTKTLAIDPDGTVLAEAVAGYPCSVPKPMYSEQDPEDWWRATVKTVRAVVAKAKIKPSEVRSIGLSGQMHGAVFLDKNDSVLRPAILWNDQRTAQECEDIESKLGGRKKLIREVANPAMTGFTAPKILWFAKHEPRRYEKTCKVLLPKDEIRRRLTGQYATDMSDASGTLLLDVARRRWSKRVLSALEIDTDWMPKCYESQEVTGTLTASAAKTLGLSTDCKVVAGAGDCAAGAIGSGIVRRGVVNTSIGTSGVVFAHSDEMKVDPEGRVHTFCHAVEGKWHMMGVNLASGGSMQWFRDTLCQADLARAKRQKKNIYDLLTEEAAATETGAEGLFFLPYLSGERTPHGDPSARGTFVGLTMAHNRGHMVRAIMEGVVYSMRESFAIFDQLGLPIGQVRATGGGSRSEFWRQIEADCFGKKVATINCQEGPAYGVALLAAVGDGAYKDIVQACRATIRTVDETRPTKKAKAYYTRAFEVYQKLYQSLKDDFKTIGQL
jgi:xylulokinase